ncbi:MAG: hypothetical protein COB66_03195 [Coxiella sp. (in: Bacteria)]|nr:MAG: hypothetical protein COB66_03195 [Coxiella sp. (in: g-proteobacteria)]
MYINEDSSAGRYQIRAYDENSITVGEQVLHDSFILTPECLITPWAPTCVADLNEQHLNELIQLAPEILLIGTGATTQLLPATLRLFLERHDIGVECMSTKAACRSYMALLSEDRKIAAILFIT